MILRYGTDGRAAVIPGLREGPLHIAQRPAAEPVAAPPGNQRIVGRLVKRFRLLLRQVLPQEMQQHLPIGQAQIQHAVLQRTARALAAKVQTQLCPAEAPAEGAAQIPGREDSSAAGAQLQLHPLGEKRLRLPPEAVGLHRDAEIFPRVRYLLPAGGEQQTQGAQQQRRYIFAVVFAQLANDLSTPIRQYPHCQRDRRTPGRTWAGAAGPQAPSRTYRTCTGARPRAFWRRTRRRTCPCSPCRSWGRSSPQRRQAPAFWCRTRGRTCPWRKRRSRGRSGRWRQVRGRAAPRPPRSLRPLPSLQTAAEAAQDHSLPQQSTRPAAQSGCGYGELRETRTAFLAFLTGGGAGIL